MVDSKNSVHVVASIAKVEWRGQSTAPELPERGIALHTIDICRASYSPKTSSKVNDRDQVDSEESNDQRCSIVFGGASGLLCIQGLHFV